MPYPDLASLPKGAKRLPKSGQEIFKAIFNNVYKRTGGKESKAFPIAYAGAKKGLKGVSEKLKVPTMKSVVKKLY